MSKRAEAIERYTAGLTHISTGPCPGCSDCGIPEDCDDYESDSCSGFSWSPCDTCGSSLGGNREPAHGVAEDGRIVHMDVCDDCVMVINYGEDDN